MLKVASLFSQILGQVSRIDFQKLVVKHGAERHSKGFRSWTQFVSMLFCHLARADSLREICHGLQSCNGKLISLGVNRNPNKSTLSYANEHRPSELFRDMFWILKRPCRGHTKDPVGVTPTLLTISDLPPSVGVLLPDACPFPTCSQACRRNGSRPIPISSKVP